MASSANFVTCNHCTAQLKVRRTESAAFTEQLDELESNQDQMLDKLSRLEKESDLAKLDRIWERQRERYMVSNSDGVKTFPSEGEGIPAMAVMVPIGVIAFAFVTCGGLSVFSVAIGLAFFGLAVLIFRRSAKNSQGYRQALARHRRKRRDIVRRHNDSRPR